jgi:hypothetical protein
MFGPAFRVTAIAVAALFPVFGHAANTNPVVPETAEALASIEVSAKQLYAAHSGIQMQTGASSYRIDATAIAATSKDNNTPPNDVIMQAPEVVHVSFGQIHSRGEYNGLQYRLSDIILPEGPSVFGESLIPRRIASVSLITGALPADYVLRTADIIDLKTKSGLVDSGGSVSLSMAAVTTSSRRVLTTLVPRESARCEAKPPISSTSPLLWAAVCMRTLTNSVRATTWQSLRKDLYEPDL